MVRGFDRAIAALKRRVLLMVGRAVVRAVDDARKLQALQLDLLAGETAGGVERFQQYGFTSAPHTGAEAVVVFPGGNRAHGLAIAVDDRRYRFKNLSPGEVALYDDLGSVVHLKRGGEIAVTAPAKLTATAPEVNVVASTKVTVTSPEAEITGNVAIGGNLAVAGTGVVTGALSSATSVSDPTGTMDAMRQVFNGHHHEENGDGGGTTDQPTEQM